MNESTGNDGSGSNALPCIAEMDGWLCLLLLTEAGKTFHSHSMMSGRSGQSGQLS